MPLQATSGAASYDAFGGGVPVEPNYIESVFSVYLYTGNGSTQTITNGIDLAGKGGLVWAKCRTKNEQHGLYDTARGAYQWLTSNGTNASTNFNPGGVSAFNSNGFTVFDDIYGSYAINGSSTSQTYASWTFRKQPKFFDVVTYTGTGSAQDIAHNLGSVPGCIIVKGTTNTFGWYGYHRSLTSSETILLNSTDAAVNVGAGAWNSTTPTSTVFSVGNGAGVNQSGQTYVAYVFAHDAGGFGLTGTDNVISCGSYTGTGAAGNAVTLGYEPQWVMVKRTDTAGFQWIMQDNMRGMSLTGDAILYANLSNAETDTSPTAHLYPTATGFTLGSSATGWNASGGTYIYIAIRRGPMKVPTTGLSVFEPVTQTQNSTHNNTVTTNFPVDFVIENQKTNGWVYNSVTTSRLQGWGPSSGGILKTSSSAAEVTGNTNYFFRLDNNTGFIDAYSNANQPMVYWNFRRAPGFFDVVCYLGNGSTQTITHNLGAVPELMIVKTRDQTGNWPTYNKINGNAQQTNINQTGASSSTASAWNSTTPTSSVFSVGGNTNSSGINYVACLFATCPGVSKVGGYTGDGSIQTINCGFAGGARFVLIKCTSITSGWYVYDTARGMTTSTDPYLFLNDTAAETATLGSVTTVTTGFAVDAAILYELNQQGETYIFLAIA